MSEMHEIWRCHVGSCGYMYDPARGDKRTKVAIGVAFDELPDTWECPSCGAGKRSFLSMATEVIDRV